MIRLYARMIIRHHRTLDTIPEDLRAKVSNMLHLWGYDDDGNKEGK